MFERMEIAEYIYEDVVEPSYENILGRMTTVLVSAGKLEDNTTRQPLTTR